MELLDTITSKGNVAVMRWTKVAFLQHDGGVNLCFRVIWRVAQGRDQFVLLSLSAFVIGVSTLVHLVTTSLKLKSWLKWLFATFVPTVGLIGWHVYRVEYGNQHPGSIGVYGFLTGGLFWFPIGFAVVNGLMLAINRIAVPERSVVGVVKKVEPPAKVDD